jgi:hypothetical protein
MSMKGLSLAAMVRAIEHRSADRRRKGEGIVTGYPYYVFILMAAALGYAFWAKRRMAGTIAASSDKRVDAVAAKLGLSITEGDGSINLLYFQQPNRDFSRRIVAVGQPYGRPVTWTLVDGKKTSELIVMRRITTTFGCVLDVETKAALPPFEVMLRQPNQYLVPDQQFGDRQDLTETRTGNPQLDALFLVRTSDPRMGPMLASALSVLAPHLYVHMAGEGNRIWTTFSQIGLPYFASAPEEYLLALESAACGVEGRAAPARPEMPVPMMAPPAT